MKVLMTALLLAFISVAAAQQAPSVEDIVHRANLVAYLRTLSDNPVPLP